MEKRYWLMLIPMLIMVSINAFIPTMVVFNYSFKNLQPAIANPQFWGMEGFRRVIHDPEFRSSVIRTLELTAIALTVEMLLGLVVASVIPQGRRSKALSVGIISLPLVMPMTSVGMLFRLTGRVGGVIPTVLNSLGIKFSIADPTQVFLYSAFADIWQWTPLVVLILYAGMEAIRPELKEAALIDRASRWSMFRNVTWPSIKWPFLVALLLRFMDVFRVFDVPYVMVGAGPENSVMFLSTYVYFTSLAAYRIGEGACASLIYLYFSIVACYILMNILLRGRELT